MRDRVVWTAISQKRSEHADEREWQKDAASKIRNADVVLALVRDDTNDSAGVAWELRFAEALQKPVIAHRESEAHAWPATLPDRAVHVTEPLLDFAERFEVVALQAALNLRNPAGSEAFVLDQYKAILESGERLDDRRQSLHAFFVSLNTVLLAAIGLIAREGLKSSQQGLLWLVPLVGLLGIFLCQTWRRQIYSYGQVRRSKFATLMAMEGALPSAPLVAEWISLSQRGYESFTESESRVPAAFRLMHAAAIAASVVAFFAG